MSIDLFQSGEVLRPPTLAPIRSHAAVVRALLDELDRLTPLSARDGEAAEFTWLGEQVAEELGRLGCRMLECAAEMAGPASGSTARPLGKW